MSIWNGFMSLRQRTARAVMWMSGNARVFSDQIDDEGMEFMTHELVTCNMAYDYYGLGLEPVTRLSHGCGAVYKVGEEVLIRRSIFEAYLREQRKG